MSLTEASESITEILAARGINFPRTPHGKDTPGSHLVRCQINLNTPFLGPQPGKDWLYGVFFGDNAKCLMKGGSLVVFRTEVVNPQGHWLIADTPQMEKLVEFYASQNPNLSLTTFGGYFYAAREVYQRFSVYHPREGIATIPREISLTQAELILVDGKNLGDFPHKIHPSIFDKLIPV